MASFMRKILYKMKNCLIFSLKSKEDKLVEIKWTENLKINLNWTESKFVISLNKLVKSNLTLKKIPMLHTSN